MASISRSAPRRSRLAFSSRRLKIPTCSAAISYSSVAPRAGASLPAAFKVSLRVPTSNSEIRAWLVPLSSATLR